MFIDKFIFYILFWCVVAARYEITLTNDGPIVRGGVITFSATVFYQNEVAQDEKFEFIWEDDGIPKHTRDIEIENSTDAWSVTYNQQYYPAGRYLIQVIVKKCVMLDVICYDIGSERQFFEITETLNGVLQMQQNNKTRDTDFVSNNETVIHFVDIKKSDRDYIKKAPVVVTYWFVDCTYYGITLDFKFPFNYTTPDESHLVEALVMADFTPLPPSTTVPPSTTTTPKPSNSTTTALQKSSITTVKPTVKMTTKPNVTKIVSNTSSRSIIKRNAFIYDGNKELSNNRTLHITKKVNGTLVPYNDSFPFVCNGTNVVFDKHRTYGYFRQKFQVKAPLSEINITGNTWLQPGNLLSLRVQCSGSKNIEYCIQYERGDYNVTGNETCFVYLPSETCDFSITRYFSYRQNTIIIILKNDVSKEVRSVFVNIYKVNKQMQLSVIVVPVAFSLVAVVLIIFGVAYYIQNRSRFIVEVADFNFGQNVDAEYKTFRERLRDSVVHAFTRAPSPSASTSEVPVWPPGQKYGSMT